MIGRLTNAQELLDIIDENEEEEECDVCKAIKDLIEDGRKEGKIERDKQLILKWIQKGKTLSEMAEDLDKPESYVRELMI